MPFVVLLFGPCSLNTITQFMTSWTKSIKLQMLIAQYSPLNDGELWISYQNTRMLFIMSDRSIKSGGWRGKDKILHNFLLLPLLLNLFLAKSGSHRSHRLRKWGLKMLGTGAFYLTHSCLALCNCPAPTNLLNCACACKDQVSPSQSWLLFLCVWNPLGYTSLLTASVAHYSLYKNSVTPLFGVQSLEC